MARTAQSPSLPSLCLSPWVLPNLTPLTPPMPLSHPLRPAHELPFGPLSAPAPALAMVPSHVSWLLESGTGTIILPSVCRPRLTPYTLPLPTCSTLSEVLVARVGRWTSLSREKRRTPRQRGAPVLGNVQRDDPARPEPNGPRPNHQHNSLLGNAHSKSSLMYCARAAMTKLDNNFPRQFPVLAAAPTDPSHASPCKG